MILRVILRNTKVILLLFVKEDLLHFRDPEIYFDVGM